MDTVRLAHAGVDHGTTEHRSLLFHQTRFDDRAGPVGLFFLHYYPLLLIIAGLLLFVALQLRGRRN